MKLWQRAFVALALLFTLGVMCVHAAETAEKRWPYPDATELSTDYEDYVGDEVLVFGTVTAVHGDELTIETGGGNERVSLTVTGTAVDIKPGSSVQVYGRLEPDRQLTAERIEVVNDSTAAELYKYGVSAVGTLIFLVAFFRYWRVDAGTWTFKSRDG